MLFGTALCGICDESEFGSNPNCTTFIPGKPVSASNLTTSSPNTPKSSAMMGAFGNASNILLKSFILGPSSHSPILAVFDSAGTAQYDAKARKWSILTVS